MRSDLAPKMAFSDYALRHGLDDSCKSSGSKDETNGASSTVADYICIARESLARMMSERYSREATIHRITLTMAAAGHDLRQRLHLLLGTVELLTSTEDELRSAALEQRAKSLIFRLAADLEQMAVQAQREIGADVSCVQSFSLSSLLEPLRSDWEPEAMKKSLRFTIDQPDCAVESDLHLLTVIMNNIVGNAVRHTAAGEITIASKIEGRFVILSVSDTGPGISQEDLRRSSGFPSSSGAGNKGMGLGLSIARRSAEILGHQLDVSSRTGRGTRIQLFVPLAKHRADDALSDSVS
jgi:two-component system, sensor histidine kinase